MPDLKQSKNRLYLMGAVLLVLDLAALAMLMTPLAGRESLRQEELRQAWLNLKARESAPWRGLDKKIPQARQDIQAFYRDRFPSSYSVITSNLDKVAAESGVKLSSEKYAQKDAEIPSLQRVEIDAEVSGDYVPLAKFINALERNQMFFMIDGLDLGGETTGSVKLHIKVETYLRNL